MNILGIVFFNLNRWFKKQNVYLTICLTKTNAKERRYFDARKKLYSPLWSPSNIKIKGDAIVEIFLLFCNLLFDLKIKILLKFLKLSYRGNPPPTICFFAIRIKIFWQKSQFREKITIFKSCSRKQESEIYFYLSGFFGQKTHIA